MSTAGYSEKDGRLVITAHDGPGGRVTGRIEILTHKDAEFDPGDSAAQNIGGGRVAFISHGAGKPMFKFTLSNGVEGLKVRNVCTYDAGGGKLGYRDLSISWAFRRAGVGSVAWSFHNAEMGKGGAFKASDGPGLEGGAFEFPMLSAKTSTNGAAYRTAA